MDQSQPSDEVLRDAYHLALRLGRTLHYRLNHFALSPRQEYPKLQPLYKVETGRLGPPKSFAKRLRTCNVDDRFLYVDVNGRGGAILINEIHKDRDTGAERLWPSEVAWQSFLLSSQRDMANPSRLENVIVHHIINYETKKVIFETTRTSTCTIEEPDGHREYTQLDNGFYAILGSLLGATAMRMLLDHKREIGYRTVERIILFGYDGYRGVQEWDRARTFLIKLSARRAAPSKIPVLSMSTGSSRNDH